MARRPVIYLDHPAPPVCYRTGATLGRVCHTAPPPVALFTPHVAHLSRTASHGLRRARRGVRTRTAAESDSSTHGHARPADLHALICRLPRAVSCTSTPGDISDLHALICRLPRAVSCASTPGARLVSVGTARRERGDFSLGRSHAWHGRRTVLAGTPSSRGSNDMDTSRVQWRNLQVPGHGCVDMTSSGCL